MAFVMDPRSLEHEPNLAVWRNETQFTDLALQHTQGDKQAHRLVVCSRSTKLQDQYTRDSKLSFSYTGRDERQRPC